MATTTFANGVTLTDEDWFNDVDRLVYDILNDPADIAAVKDALHSAPGPIGDTTPSTGAFTTLSATGTISSTKDGTVLNGVATTPGTVQTITLNDGGNRIIKVASPNASTNAKLGTSSNHSVDLIINDAAVGVLSATGLNSTAIGATTPSTGAFTGLTVTGAGITSTTTGANTPLIAGETGVSQIIIGNGGTSTNYIDADTTYIRTGAAGAIGQFTSTGLNSCAIGATTPSTGAFTTIKTESGLTTCPNTVATTIYSITTNSLGLYLVSAHITNAGPTLYSSAAYVLYDGGVGRLVTISNASSLSITLDVATDTVQVTQVSGVSSDVSWVVLRIA